MSDFTAAFNETYQQHFVNHLLRDGDFLAKVAKKVTPDLFSNDVAQRVVRLALDFFKQHESAPGPLVFQFLADVKSKGLVNETTAKTIDAYLSQLFGYPLQNRNYLLTSFSNFIRQQQFKHAIIPAKQLMDKGEYQKAEDMMKQAFMDRPLIERDLGRHFEADPSERVRRRQQEVSERFWTLIPDVDRRLPGLKRGELGVLQSQRSSGGKSAGLVFLTRSFVFQAKRVLIYSLEMSEEDYEDRLDMCVAGLTREALTDRSTIMRNVNKMFKHGGDIWIKQFPGQLTTVSDLMKHKRELEAFNSFHADAVIVDYADELAPEEGTKADNSFGIGKEIYSRLRGWAVRDQVVIWTGMQSNRGGMEATVADQEHSGESIAKAWISDLIISLNRSPEEEKANQTRLWVVKARQAAARYPIVISSDFSRMLFWKRDL